MEIHNCSCRKLKPCRHHVETLTRPWQVIETRLKFQMSLNHVAILCAALRIQHTDTDNHDADARPMETQAKPVQGHASSCDKLMIISRNPSSGNWKNLETAPKGPLQHHSSSLGTAATQPISKPYPQQVTRITDQLREWMNPQGPSLQTAWPMTQAQHPIAIAD